MNHRISNPLRRLEVDTPVSGKKLDESKAKIFAYTAIALLEALSDA
jgi:hypothetical protein